MPHIILAVSTICAGDYGKDYGGSGVAWFWLGWVGFGSVDLCLSLSFSLSHTHSLCVCVYLSVSSVSSLSLFLLSRTQSLFVAVSPFRRSLSAFLSVPERD